MSKRCSALVCSVLLGIAAARPRPPGCGTYAGIASEEIFLHARHMAARAKLGLARAAAPSAAHDIGEIAVLDDSDGVVGRRNVFNLDRRTLTFQPSDAAATRYRFLIAEDSFDDAASQAGAPLDGLDDDDTREIALPFAFPFFGGRYQQAWVNSDGNITFTGGDANNLNRTFGDFTGGPPRIAGLFTDLDPTQSANGVRVLAEAGRVVVTWAGVPLYSDFGLAPIQNFQIRLYSDGRIEIAWRSANPRDAVVGIAPGALRGQTSLVSFVAGSAAEFSAAVGERFTSFDEIDVVTAAQKFYETHEDAYDYLVIYNTLDIPARSNAVAYQVTVRNNRSGYGDAQVEFGSVYGSRRRLQSVLNLGPLSQYPSNPNAVVPGRFLSGDTALTVLGHEAGHLFLAYASIRDPDDPQARPMLGRGLVHWAFTFNSDASLLEGNRIADAGEGNSPRFTTTATVEGYSALDQYLMGLRAPEEVSPTFLVTHTNVGAARSPQVGVAFDGDRRDIAVDEIIQAQGRRTPDSTVAQRRFRFAFILVAAQGADPAPEAIAQIDRYRAEFESFYARAAGGRALAETTLRRALAFSAFPALGVAQGQTGTASIVIERSAITPLTIALRTSDSFVATPATVTIPAGATRVPFQLTGLRPGVEDITAEAAGFETAFARLRVQPADALRLRVVANAADSATLRVVDLNNLPYPGVRVTATAAAGGGVQPAEATTDEAGLATFRFTGNAVRITVAGVPGSAVAVGRPAIDNGGVVNAASYTPGVAAGGFASIFGAALAAGATASAPPPFLDRLEGVQVLVNGTPALLYSVSDRQINFVVPPGAAPGPADIVVVTAIGASSATRIEIKSVAPGIFFDPISGLGAVRVAGDFLEIYCTGLGPIARSEDGLDRTLAQPEVNIAGLRAELRYSGLAPGVPGLYQVNVRVPEGMPAGAQTLTLQLNGVSANPVKVQFR